MAVSVPRWGAAVLGPYDDVVGFRFWESGEPLPRCVCKNVGVSASFG
jgi:hypothetical protein